MDDCEEPDDMECPNLARSSAFQTDREKAISNHKGKGCDQEAGGHADRRRLGQPDAPRTLLLMPFAPRLRPKQKPCADQHTTGKPRNEVERSQGPVVELDQMYPIEEIICLPRRRDRRCRNQISLSESGVLVALRCWVAR